MDCFVEEIRVEESVGTSLPKGCLGPQDFSCFLCFLCLFFWKPGPTRSVQKQSGKRSSPFCLPGNWTHIMLILCHVLQCFQSDQLLFSEKPSLRRNFSQMRLSSWQPGPGAGRWGTSWPPRSSTFSRGEPPTSLPTGQSASLSAKTS